MTKSKPNLWPWGIVVTLLIFATFIVTIAVYISGKNVDLESKDYYSQSVDFESIIEMRKAFDALEEKPTFYTNETGKFTIKFPTSYWSKIDSGSVRFFKPENASLDFESKFKKPMAASLSLLTDERKKGNWKMKFIFSMHGLNYFTEEQIVLK